MRRSRREALVEAAAEASDELMMKYLESEPLTDAEIEAALHKGTREGSVVPVFVGSALGNIGVRELITMIAHHVPSPAEVGGADDGATAPGSSPIRPRPSWRRCSRRSPTRSSAGSPTSASSPARSTRRRTCGTPRARRRSASATSWACSGKEQENLPQVGPGDIAAVAKLTNTQTGDTLVADRSARGRAAAHQLPGSDPPGADRAGEQGGPRQARPGTAAHARGGALRDGEPRGGDRRDGADRHG